MAKKTNNSDDSYVSAVQPIVDDAMRTDNMGPIIRQCVCDHKPLNDEIQKTVVETIQRNPDAKTAIDEVVAQNKALKQNKIIGNIVAGVIGGGALLLLQWVFSLIGGGNGS
ncbi:hypothetical protein FWH09_01415 [Candidatus Saccharibacteria bacterium]|nr:hypothetical protein [Candidatus Saccharibacteria bacterium]